MRLKYFDAHTHVQFAAFEKDYREVIGRALAAGVGLINVGTQKDTSLRATEVAHEFENESVYAAVGLHPIHTDKSYYDPQEFGTAFSNSRELETGGVKGFLSRGEEFDYGYYKKLALDPKVVAIGECGLDFFQLSRKKNEEPKNRRNEAEEQEIKIKTKQKQAFVEQIKLAHEVGKPLMIHCRNAFPDLIETISHNSKFIIPNNPGIIHFFSGTVEHAKTLLELGFSFTFGGVITFARDYDEVIKMIPLERILSETDAPYVTPVPHRGKRNEPAYVIEVVKKLAEIKGVAIEKMQEQVFRNVKRVFNINPL